MLLHQITTFIKVHVPFDFGLQTNLIDRFYKNLSIKGSEGQKQRSHEFL